MKEVSFAQDFGYVMNSLDKKFFLKWRNIFFIAKVLAKDYVYVTYMQSCIHKHMYTHIYIYIQYQVPMFRSMFCRKGRMAVATRNTLTFARPMISGPWAFCEPVIYR